MSRIEKQIQKMRENPKNFQIDTLINMAARFGIEVTRPAGGSSHVTFKHPSVETILTVPAHRPVKPVYIKKFLALLDEVK